MTCKTFAENEFKFATIIFCFFSLHGMFPLIFHVQVIIMIILSLTFLFQCFCNERFHVVKSSYFKKLKYLSNCSTKVSRVVQRYCLPLSFYLKYEGLNPPYSSRIVLLD